MTPNESKFVQTLHWMTLGYIKIHGHLGENAFISWFLSLQNGLLQFGSIILSLLIYRMMSRGTLPPDICALIALSLSSTTPCMRPGTRRMGQRTCCMVIEHVLWPWNLLHRRRTCSMAIEHVQWPYNLFSGHRTCFYGHRTCSMAMEHVLWAVEHVAIQHVLCLVKHVLWP